MYYELFHKLKTYVDKYPEKKKDLILLTQKELENMELKEKEGLGFPPYTDILKSPKTP